MRKIADAVRFNFARYLDQTLHDLALSHQTVANELGVKKFTVDSWTRGTPKIPARPTLEALCTLLERRQSGAGRALAAAAGVTWIPAPTASSSIPLPLDRFWGRQDELAALNTLLQEPIRLVTLTGPGGVGKTRLAAEVARQQAVNFAHGVQFVFLDTLREPERLAEVLVRSLGLRENPARNPLHTLKEHLAERQILLVLDNFEQLLAGTPLIEELLQSAPGLRLLLTSREPLHRPWEQQFAVPPLPLPDPAQPFVTLVDEPAVQLFVDRAQKVQLSFALTPENAPIIAAICQRLEGLPLPIELAAARSNTFPPTVLLRELAVILPFLVGGGQTHTNRQQTMQACIRWSYDLLAPAEQHLFRQLAVLHGGGTLPAAVALSDQPPTVPGQAAVYDQVFSLASKGLLRVVPDGAEPRLTLLEPIREFAWQALTTYDETDAVQRRHADYYGTLAEAGTPHLHGPDQQRWLERLDQEYANIQAALEWAKAQADDRWGVRIFGALQSFWYRRGHHRAGYEWAGYWAARASQNLGPVNDGPSDEVARWRVESLYTAAMLAARVSGIAAAQDWLEQILPWYQAWGDTKGQAKVLYMRGFLLEALGIDEPPDHTPRACYEASLALCQATGDHWGLARAYYALGYEAQRQHDYPAASDYYQHSVAHSRAANDVGGIARALNDLGGIADYQAQYAISQAYYEESNHYFRQLGDVFWVGITLSNLGWEIAWQDDYPLAATRTRESLACFQQLGEKRYVVMQQVQLATIARGQGDLAAAQRAVNEAVAQYQAIGDQAGLGTAYHQWGFIALQRGAMGPAADHFRHSLRLWQAAGDSIWRRGWNTGCLVGLARIALHATADPAARCHAACLLGAVTALTAAAATILQPLDRALLQRAVAELQPRCADPTIAASWANGQRMSIHEAIAAALGETAPLVLSS